MVAFQFTPLVTPKSVLMGVGMNKLNPLSSHSSLMAPKKKTIMATSTAKWDARYSHPVPHTNDYYIKCMFGGVLSCGTTHFSVTPLDMAKCNMQVGGVTSRGIDRPRTMRMRLPSPLPPVTYTLASRCI